MKEKTKNIIAFILSIITISVILYGTCLLNMTIAEGLDFTICLIIIWPLLPIIIFSRIAKKTKLQGVKIAVRVTIVLAIIYWLLMYSAFNS